MAIAAAAMPADSRRTVAYRFRAYSGPGLESSGSGIPFKFFAAPGQGPAGRRVFAQAQKPHRRTSVRRCLPGTATGPHALNATFWTVFGAGTAGWEAAEPSLRRRPDNPNVKGPPMCEKT